MKNYARYSSDYSHRFLFEKNKNKFPNRGKHMEDGFPCKKCGFFVITNPCVSGVQNRNHCPCCLWSRHMDLLKAGDRLSACKDLMKPIGLTMKKYDRKYGVGLGELMLVHQCSACNTISINRIASDDIPQIILEVLKTSTGLSDSLRGSLRLSGIKLLSCSDAGIVQAGLFGFGHMEMEAQMV